MAPVRVAFADDSTVFRSVLRKLLDDPRFEIVGSGRDGLEAVQLARDLKPEVMLLDVEMPGLDGLGVLRELADMKSRTRVVLVSSQTNEGSDTTLEGLRLGASDFVLKPAGTTLRANMEELSETLLPKLLALASSPATMTGTPRASAHLSRRTPEAPPKRLSATPRTPAAPPARPGAPSAARFPRGAQAPEILAIASSTGGPVALMSVVPALPADLRVPVVIVQHMPPGFTKMLAQRLNSLSAIRVVEAEHGQSLEPGVAYLAPGGFHMTLKPMPGLAPVIQLDEGERILGCRPAADRLLPSVAAAYGAKVLAVVLTGMGEDGTVGCRRVREAGGRVIAEHESSCVVYGMPRAVVEAGLANAVHDLASITERLGAWASGMAVLG